LAAWASAVAQSKTAILAVLHTGEETSRKSGLVSGVASTGAAAAIFLAIFALLLLLRFVA
jgi:hypothetical protein